MKFLDIHREERLKVFLAWSLNGLLATGHAFGWASVHAMLVKRVGVSAMPVAYVFANLLGLIASFVYLRFADSIRRDHALVRTALILGGLLAGAWLLIEVTGYAAQTDEQSHAQGLTVVAGLFFAIGIAVHGVGKSTLKAQTWTLFNDIFRPSQGKRVYPIITTAKALGGLCGGLLVAPLTAWFGLPACVLAWAGSIFLLLPLTWLMVHCFGAELQGGQPRPRPHVQAGHGSEAPPRVRDGLRYCAKSPLVGLLAGLVLIYWVCNQLHDYQYTRIMNNTFGDEENLGRWFGYYIAGFNVVCLFTQLFIAPRALSWLGVGRTLLLQPLSGLAGFAAVMASFTFYPGLFLRAIWDLSEDGFYHSAFQLVFNGVPSGWRGRARGFVEGIVNPVGGMIGGVAIIVLNRFNGPIGGFWHFGLLSVVGFGGCVIYLLLSIRTRHVYVQSAMDNLAHPDRRTQLDSVEALEERGHPGALARLESLAAAGELEIRRLALRCLARLHYPPAFSHITRMLDDPDATLRESAFHAARGFRRTIARSHPEQWSDLLRRANQHVAQDDAPRVRAEAARLLLETADAPRATSLIRDLLDDPHEEVRIHVVDTLATLRLDGIFASLQPYLNDQRPRVRAATAVALWRAAPAAQEVAETTLRNLLGSAGGPELSAGLTGVARLPTPKFAAEIRVLLEHPAAEIQALAAMAFLATGLTGHPTWPRAVSSLAGTLSDPAREPELRAHLVPLFGELPADALDALLAAAAGLSPERREQAARILHELYPALLKSLEPS